MKFIRLLMLFFSIITLLFGCKEEREEFETNDSCFLIDYVFFDSQDSLYSYIIVQKNLIKCPRIIGNVKVVCSKNIIWQKELELPDSIKVDIGYGESQYLNFTQNFIIGDNKDLLFIAHGIKYKGAISMNYVGIYDANGNFISNIPCIPNYDYTSEALGIIGYTRWNDNSIIVTFKLYTTSDSEYGYIIIDENAHLQRRKENIVLWPCKDPDFTWREGYSFISDNKFIICNIETGSDVISINEIISSRYPEEVYPPKVKINKVSSQGDIAILDIDLTLYTGQHKTETLRINYKTGEINS